MAEIIIAVPGGSVNDDEKDLAFTSNRNCITEIQEDIVTIDVTELATIPHNLGYYPSYTLWRKTRDITDSFDVWELSLNGGYVDTNNLYIEDSAGIQYSYKLHANASDGGGGTGNDNIVGNIIIAKNGINLKTNTDARNIQFMSGKNVPKIDRNLSGSVTATIATDDITVISIEHNLGYYPVCYVHSVTDGQNLPIAEPVPHYFHISTTHLYILVENFSLDPTYSETFKYIITRDKIA